MDATITACVAHDVKVTVVRTVNASSAPLPMLQTPTQTMVVMMERMQRLQERIEFVACAVDNSSYVPDNAHELSCST